MAPPLTLFIGEAYGAEEEEASAAVGRPCPFVGPTGKELHDELEAAGWLPSGTAATINRALYAAGSGAISWRAAVDRRDSILAAAGIAFTNLVSARPPANKLEAWFYTKTAGREGVEPPIHDKYPHPILRDGLRELSALIARLAPKLIVCLGSHPLWAITGEDGITKWRSSSLLYHPSALLHHPSAIPVACTLHPSAVLREWPWRPVVIHDLKRALHERNAPTPIPQWDFLTRPSLDQALEHLDTLLGSDEPLAADTETVGGRLACLSFADTPLRAVCIPFLNPEEPDGNYWRTDSDEQAVALACRRVLQRRRIVFHNGLYDMQIFRREWGFWPNWTDDTMVAQHVAFPGLLGAGLDPVTGETSKKGSSLSLAFLASMYCRQYAFWKDDGRLWDPSVHPPEQYWRYNCEDSARTLECHFALQEILLRAGLKEQYEFQCRALGPATLRIMQRGIALDNNLRKRQLADIHLQLQDCERWFERVLGHPLNPQSNPQMKALFYGDLRCPEQWKGRGDSRTLTCDDEALERIVRLRPQWRPLVRRIQDYRTLAVLGGKAQDASRQLLTCRLSADNRFRFSLNLCGAETFRYSGGPNAFGEGCNPQNISKGRG